MLIRDMFDLFSMSAFHLCLHLFIELLAPVKRSVSWSQGSYVIVIDECATTIPESFIYSNSTASTDQLLLYHVLNQNT